jgi:TFIIF-interacting CTD phosphatase-like protein
MAMQIATENARRTLLIILDLDGTLIHSGPQESKRIRLLDSPPDFFVEGIQAFKRPGVEQLLHVLTRLPHVKVAVWTAASASYAQQVVHELFPDKSVLQFVYDAQQRGVHTKGGIKDLRTLPPEFKLDWTIMVDDSPSACYPRENVICVPTWTGPQTEADDVLVVLLEYFKHLTDILIQHQDTSDDDVPTTIDIRTLLQADWYKRFCKTSSS